MIYFPTVFRSSPVLPHVHSYILPCKLQLGMQPRLWISTKRLCSRREGWRWFICNPAIKKEWHLPWSFCIKLAMSKCFREAMLFPLQRKWQSGLAICRRSFTTVLDGTSPLPLLLQLSSLFLISLQDQVQLNLRLHARASRFYCPVGVLHPVTACKTEVIVSELKPFFKYFFFAVSKSDQF